MKDLSTISSDLFNKIRSRFSDIKIGDETGAVTNDESEARFFDVNYTVGDHELGRVNIKIDDDALTVIYNTDMLSDKALEAKDDWYKFLKDMRQFARSNLLTFDTRDITKSNLDQRDYEYLSKESGEQKMSESRLFGTSKTSYQDVGEAKIIVKHSAPVNYNNPAGRTQRIESIYIESANGERFRYPSKHLNGARAMAVHVANGGAPYDAIGGYISGLSEEIGKLRQFKNYTQRSGVVAEALGPISEQVAERLSQLKLEVAALQRQHYYESFRENFKPMDAVEVPEETMSEWVDALTIKTFNEELTSVFPYIYRLVKEKAEQGLTYDDIVAEATTCEVCNEDPCTCDDEKVEETNHLADFEQHLEDLTTFDYDVVESDKGDMDHDGENEPDDQEYLQNKDQAIKKATGSLSEEIVEFIKSMYDANTGTFPRGEEGVKIACEKKFGESAGRFAQFAVERLSSKAFDPEQFGSDGAGAGAGDISKDDEEMKEGALDEFHADLNDKFNELAPSIKKYKDNEGANRLYDELLSIAKQHGVAGVREFKSMLNGAQRRAHLEYDTNPGGFENWFWFLPLGDSNESARESAELLDIRRLAGM